ncbi:GTP-binding protein [Vibrio breoganii]|uniref:CobW family GTP-binding protein n=1 Tax=Vibrio breoganii TaxID=553239 RepID=UPI000C85C5A7|nr:GTP-binding protein [Vibrio breoganii]PML65140.1 cobalamin biosynthesis protein P47K [Vibrio breoganii]PMM82349.1 cobalamin biosynthesis protein P47K [Vibrio breoganii]PMO62436.1 cobalamin biosynthesis protein P47K [Vibrio breoganii]PMO81742.1 cobalamin biosynthesis protein P47K [Vibrio breoganii]PMP04810.1 cobalamin biosynthesis protein P47K [Vibrio breoganii]
MKVNKALISGVPINIITGFLGVGKTSAILHLMSIKPSNERWAVLVNEFGEIGIDGSLIQGKQNQDGQVYIREVPGGCMCCAAGLPMQIALNQLLSESKPDRLLIEPTGLGHPREVLQVLSTDYYRQIINLQKNITLVDARKLSDPRCTEHDTFNQQIAIADTVVGNKRDLYQQGDEENLADYVGALGLSETKVIYAEHGEIPFAEFEGATQFHKQKTPHLFQQKQPRTAPVPEPPIPESGILKATNKGEGFHSVGWRMSADRIFNRQKLLQLLGKLTAERMKAVFITESGIFGYNLTADGLTEIELDECSESRLEIISDRIDDSFEEQLLGCIE